MELGAATQPTLLPEAELDPGVFAQDEAAGIYTAGRLRRHEPRIYAAVVTMLATELTIRQIARLLHVSEHTVIAVKRAEPVEIERERSSLAGKAFTVAHLAMDSVVDDMVDPEKRKKVPTRDKMLVAMMAVDKGQLLSGGPTGRIEVSDPPARNPQDVFNEYLASLKSAVPQIEVSPCLKKPSTPNP